MSNMVRVNTRIPKHLNDWLDEQTEINGVPKSTQILLALEDYYTKKNAPNQLSEIARLIAQAQELEEKKE